MGGVLGPSRSFNQGTPIAKFEAKMVETMRKRDSVGSSMKSFNSFPKIDASLRKWMTIFEKFDQDSNGATDQEELEHCFQKLEISFTEDEIPDLFEACDINEDMGMGFNEFIVLLCLVYRLQDPSVMQAKSGMGLASLESTFEALVDAFVFLDKNKDGACY